MSFLKINAAEKKPDIAVNNGLLFLAVQITSLRPDPEQPRKHFEEIEGLATSIKARGLIQPILVRPNPDLPDHYIIKDGERRYRACQLVGVEMVQVFVQTENKNNQHYIDQVVTNIQRDNMKPIEQALALQRCLDIYDGSYEMLIEQTGFSRSYISKQISILKGGELTKQLARDTNDINAIYQFSVLEKRSPKEAETIFNAFTENSLKNDLRSEITTALENVKKENSKSKKDSPEYGRILPVKEVFISSDENGHILHIKRGKTNNLRFRLSDEMLDSVTTDLKK